jgi:thiol-disulfide isomerase/thioredoxin
MSTDPVAVGTQASDFKVNPAAEPGRSVSLSQFKGKVVLVDFWATWCAPCRQMLPHIQKMYEDYKDKGLEVMAISAESSAKVTGFQSENKFDFPAYTDEGKEANNAFSITGLPTTIVIGKDGKVVYSTMGMDTNTPDEIQTAVTKALE